MFYVTVMEQEGKKIYTITYNRLRFHVEEGAYTEESTEIEKGRVAVK